MPYLYLFNDLLVQDSPLNQSGWSPLLAPVVFSQHKFDLKSCIIQALPILTKHEGSMQHTQRPAHTCWHSHQVRHSGFPLCQARCLLWPGSLVGAFCSLKNFQKNLGMSGNTKSSPVSSAPGLRHLCPSLLYPLAKSELEQVDQAIGTAYEFIGFCLLP